MGLTKEELDEVLMARLTIWFDAKEAKECFAELQDDITKARQAETPRRVAHREYMREWTKERRAQNKAHK
jgi:hypothetical protein